MLGLLVILLLSGVCMGGWCYRKRRKYFDYDQLDAEMEALRRTIEHRHE